jgi:ABC-type multidrug transport system fused ATPase/permease subunit
MEILMGYRIGYSGQILINQQELRSISYENLRSRISYISANPYFFNTTIKQNLLLARKDVDDQTLREILSLVGLFNPPQIDIDSVISEQGKNFSSGELQKLALAQAILKDGDLLIFDEPFENLDPISSQTFVELLNDLFENRTMLFISHNYNHMKHFNKIIALDHGQLVGI